MKWNHTFSQMQYKASDSTEMHNEIREQIQIIIQNIEQWHINEMHINHLVQTIT